MCDRPPPNPGLSLEMGAGKQAAMREVEALSSQVWLEHTGPVEM